MNDFLLGIAPTIASALLGPLGGVAVAGLGKIFGLDAATTKDVTKAIAEGKITPDQLADIKKLEMEFQAKEKELGFRFTEHEFKDRDSARQMQIATKSSTPTVLTYMITIGFFAILGLMLYDDNIVNSPPLLIMLGSLGTAWTGCIAYWFGTTSNSLSKTNLLAQSAPK
jgi:hypothetical protein